MKKAVANMASRPRSASEAPNPVDIHVGAKVKTRRITLGLSQEELADAIGLTFQQVQKYERGTNRISASRLYQIAKALKVPIEFFFDGASNARAKATGFAESKQQSPYGSPEDIMARRDTLELVRAYTEIEDPALKKQLLMMAKTMGGTRKKRTKKS